MGASILIVQAKADTLTPLLTAEGYQVVPLDATPRPTPHLIIIDAEHPDAFALCLGWREAGAAPILMLLDDPETVEPAFLAGASDVLLKPLPSTLLLRRVHALIEAQRQRVNAHEQSVLADALRNTAAALSSTLDQDEVLDRILEQVNLVVPSESANIMLIEAGIATVARARGYERMGMAGMIARLRVKVLETPALRWMFDNNRALVIPNVDEYDQWLTLDPSDGWLKSYVAAPIRLGNYVIGFLNIDSTTPNSFKASDAEHLQIFADQAAIAIHNARLFDRVRRQAAEMERRVIQRTAELDYERSQMSAILDAMTEGVAYTAVRNGAYHTGYINRALEQMTGYSPAEWDELSVALFRAKGMNDHDFYALIDRTTAELRENGYARIDLRMMRKDGSEFDAVAITTVLDSRDSDLISMVTVIRDVSQEKALRQQKERFVTYASHELRTPITNLKTRLYLMRRQPDHIHEHMRVLEYVTDRMKRLVADLLDVSRFERGVITLELKEVLLQDLIRMVVLVQQPEAEGKGLQLVCTLPEVPIRVHADPERLGQVVTNLLTNAINYTHSGRIVLRLSEVSGDSERARIEIQDSGVGISPDHLPHIFQPFYRVISQVEGSGLGLSIAKEIVELHGGALEVDSQIGVGSTFRVSLPLLVPAGEARE
jgi:PAS domain S-box-containing protein